MKAIIEKKHIFDCNESEIDDLSIGKLSLPDDQVGFFDFDRFWNSKKKEIKTLFFEYKKKTKEEIQTAYNMWALGLYKKAIVSIFQNEYSKTNSGLEREVFDKEIRLIRECDSAFVISQKIKTFPHYKNFMIKNAIKQQEEAFQLHMMYILQTGETKVLPPIPSFRFVAIRNTLKISENHVNTSDIPSIARQSGVPYVISDFYSYRPTYSCYLSKDEIIFLLAVACSYSYPAHFNEHDRVSHIVWEYNKKWIYDNDPEPSEEKLFITKYNGIQTRVLQERLLRERLLEFSIEWNEHCDRIYGFYFDPDRKSRNKSPMKEVMKKEFQDFLNS